MTLPLVIVNPTSAGGNTADVWSQIASDVRSQFGAFQNVFTEGPGHAVTLASEAARKGVKLIIACGGDGTVSEVANGFSRPVKTLNLASFRVARAEISDERSKFLRKAVRLRACCARDKRDKSTSVVFRSSIITAPKRCGIFWVSPLAV